MRCHNSVAIVLALAVTLLPSAPATAGQMDNRPVKKISGGEWLEFSKPELVEISKKVLAMPDISLKAHEEIIRIRSLEMDWDIGSMIYEPEDLSKVPTGADGKKVGLSAQFKAENIIHFDSPSGLESAARATARRLKLTEPETKKLVDRYVGYLRELSGPEPDRCRRCCSSSPVTAATIPSPAIRMSICRRTRR